MVKCTFCGNELVRGTGLMYVKEDGTIFYFDRRKCRMNMLKLRHTPRKTRWTTYFIKGKPDDRTNTRPAQT